MTPASSRRVTPAARARVSAPSSVVELLKVAVGVEHVRILDQRARCFRAVIAACDGCDVLVSEGYPSRILEREPGRRDYMRAFHTSALELGVLATRARAKQVVVTHRRSGIPDRVLLDEIHRGYAGLVVLANDLDRF